MSRKSKIGAPKALEIDPSQKARQDQEHIVRCQAQVNGALAKFRCKIIPEIRVISTQADTNLSIVPDKKFPLFDLSNRFSTPQRRTEMCGAEISAALKAENCALQGGMVLTIKGNSPIVVVVFNG